MANEPTVAQTEVDTLSDYTFRLNRWILKPIGVWPSSSSISRKEKMLSLILIVICYCFILTTSVPCILYIILDDDDVQKKLAIIGPLSHYLVGGLNYTTLLLRGKQLLRCVKHVQNDWRSVVRAKDFQVLVKHARFGRYVATFYTAFVQGGVFCYCVMTGFTTEIVQVGNETRIVHLLPCTACSKLIPEDTSPTNEILLAVQFVTTFIVNSSIVGTFSLAITFAAHASGQLNVLVMWITEFVNETKDGTSRLNKIGVVVEYHLKALNFVSHIEDVMTELCFLELFKCTFNICMLGYYILMNWDNRDFQSVTSYVIIFCSMTFNIFVLCYIGEKLSEQCKKVGDAVYMTEWYYLPYKDVHNLILIILRSSVVTKITAAKFIHMSLYTFAGVMKTAFAYLNMLRQTT